MNGLMDEWFDGLIVWVGGDQEELAMRRARNSDRIPASPDWLAGSTQTEKNERGGR